MRLTALFNGSAHYLLVTIDRPVSVNSHSVLIQALGTSTYLNWTYYVHISSRDGHLHACCTDICNQNELICQALSLLRRLPLSKKMSLTEARNHHWSIVWLTCIACLISVNCRVGFHITLSTKLGISVALPFLQFPYVRSGWVGIGWDIDISQLLLLGGIWGL